MSNSHSFDPKNGFIALPFDLLDLDLTPGAFRTLIEFCKMSNLEGFCWPSLAQIGEKLGRSKASISAYVKELRETGLLKTHAQKTATGYNYRLKFELTFWKSWRQKMSVGKPADKPRSARPAPEKSTERRVQPAKRNNINHNHLNQKEDSQHFNSLKKDWGHLTKGENYPNFKATPSQDLIEASQRIINSVKSVQSDISADIVSHLDLFIDSNKLTATGEARRKTIGILTAQLDDQSQVSSLFSALNAMWMPYWKHLPSEKQLSELVVSLEFTPSQEQQAKLLRSYLARWEHWSNATKKVA